MDTMAGQKRQAESQAAGYCLMQYWRCGDFMKCAELWELQESFSAETLPVRYTDNLQGFCCFQITL